MLIKEIKRGFMAIFSTVREMEPSPFTKYQITNLQKLKSGFFVSKNRVEKNREREKKKEDIWRPLAALGEYEEIRANPEFTCSFLKNVCRWNMHLGCSTRSRTACKVVPLVKISNSGSF